MLTGKYCEHLPLYRQSEIFARQGVRLSRALLSNWVDACCQLMTPVNDALYRYVMNTRKIHTDDTPVKVLAPGQKKAKTGRIWTYVRDDRNVGSIISSSGLVRVLAEPAGRNTRSNTSVPSGVSCRRMRSQVTTGCSVQNVKVVH